MRSTFFHSPCELVRVTVPASRSRRPSGAIGLITTPFAGVRYAKPADRSDARISSTSSLHVTTARTITSVRRELVAGRLERAGSLPPPDQEHVLVTRVVEAVPIARGRVDHVARLGGLGPVVRVDLTAAADHDQELVAVRVPVAVVARTGREHGPAHHEARRPGRPLVDQELHLHVDPALVLAQPLLERDVADRGPIWRGHQRKPPIRWYASCTLTMKSRSLRSELRAAFSISLAAAQVGTATPSRRARSCASTRSFCCSSTSAKTSTSSTRSGAR